MKVKKVVVDGKEVEFKLFKRYTEKRKAEKEMNKLLRNEYIDKNKKPLVKRKTEIEIPIDIDKKTTIFVRESKLLSKKKWLDFFNGDVNNVKAYIEEYKKSDYYKSRKESLL